MLLQLTVNGSRCLCIPDHTYTYRYKDCSLCNIMLFWSWGSWYYSIQKETEREMYFANLQPQEDTLWWKERRGGRWMLPSSWQTPTFSSTVFSRSSDYTWCKQHRTLQTGRTQSTRQRSECLWSESKIWWYKGNITVRALYCTQAMAITPHPQELRWSTEHPEHLYTQYFTHDLDTIMYTIWHLPLYYN